MQDEMILCGDGQMRSSRDLRTKSHRELYPDQYRHPLVGKRVKVTAEGHSETIVPDGTVARVINSAFGTVASAPEWGNNWYKVSDCKPV